MDDFTKMLFETGLIVGIGEDDYDPYHRDDYEEFFRTTNPSYFRKTDEEIEEERFLNFLEDENEDEDIDAQMDEEEDF